MSLAPGIRLGPYEVAAQIGAGGMGQVYRAHDTKLNRHVAIKILPELFANDPDRLARFTREAQVLASLNHPNIAAIYGIEETDGVRALVMELVEGDDLSTLITSGQPEAERVSSRSKGMHARRSPGGGAPGEPRDVGMPLADAL